MSETRQFIIFLCVFTATFLSFWNLVETIRLRADFNAGRAALNDEVRK